MANNQNTELEAHAKHQKTILIFGMVWVEKSDGIFVQEGRLSFLKRHLVLSFVFTRLILIPCKFNSIHMYNVRIGCEVVKKFDLSNRL